MADEVNQEGTLPSDDQTAESFVELVGEGKAERFTTEQVKALAQKGQYVLPKTQAELDRLKAELEETRSTAKNGESFVKDFSRLVAGDEEEQSAALSRIARSLNMTENEFKHALTGFGSKDVTGEDIDQDEAPRGKRRAADDEPRRFSREDIDPEVLKDLDFAKQVRLERLRNTVLGQLDATFDSDPEIKKILSGSNTRAAKFVKQYGQQALERRVAAKGDLPGPQTFREVVNDVHEMLESLGTRGEESKEPSLAAMGLGRVADSLGEVLHQSQPPKRVSVREGESYRNNFRDRMLHLLKSKGGVKKIDEE
jgi:hypothetical protein